MITRRGLLLATAGLALAGCAAAPNTAPPVVQEPATAVPPTTAAPAPDPVKALIPDLGIASPLVGLGLAEDGTAAVPPVTEPHVVTWFEPGVKPGDPGPAVILGHRSGRPEGSPESVPGIFARLDELQPGDPIQVVRADNTVAWFLVRAVETHDKDAFPTQAVWGNTPGPELRLITCGGIFDAGASSYQSNVIVFADLTAVTT